MDSPIKKEVIIGDCRLLLGDCREILPLIGKVDAVVTDPPYGIGVRTGTISIDRNRNDYGVYADTPENIDMVVVPAISSALDLAKRGCVTPGPRAVFKYPESRDLGAIFQPASVGMSYWGRCTFQPVLFYGKDPRSGLTIVPLHFANTEKSSCDLHPCAKPMGVARWMVLRASLDNELVLDPFMGSGTTGVACVKLGRKFIGIEIDESYFDIASDRIRKAYAQPDMFIAPPAPKAVQEVML